MVGDSWVGIHLCEVHLTLDCHGQVVCNWEEVAYCHESSYGKVLGDSAV